MALAVLGAGAWGTALAAAFAPRESRVILWGRDEGAMALMAEQRENVRWLPGVTLPPSVEPTADLARLRDADLVLAAVPAQALRAVLETIRETLQPSVPVVLCCKGIERDTGLLMSEVVAQSMPGRPVAALSGPSFASDVGRGLPTALTLATPDLDQASLWAGRLSTPVIRTYHTDDLRGVEIGGAVKNVLAIACGIAAGRGLGASAVAALTARSVAELLRYGEALGARAETLMGLSGLGDLVLTCGSAQSRNFGHGVALGRGEPPARLGVVEGVATAAILSRTSRAAGVEMPIVEAVAAVLDGSITVEQAIGRLMARPRRAEHERRAP